MDPVQNLKNKIKKYPWTCPWQGVHGTGPKLGSMEPAQSWGPWCPGPCFFHLGPKQSQNRVFKFKLSHRSFSCWQADLCEFGGKFCGGSAILRVHEWRPPKFSTKVGTFHTILHPPYQAPAGPRPTISGPDLPYQAPCILSWVSGNSRIFGFCFFKSNSRFHKRDWLTILLDG